MEEVTSINKRSDNMDKVYIDNNQRAEVVKLPLYGEVKLIIKDGKVVQYCIKESHVLPRKKPEK